ncbi:MAG: dephospho-CoA kinase [bacterium]
MLLIGVTGGIGSGKSLVCSMFAHLSVPLISADPLAKELMVSDHQLQRNIISLLGKDAYLPSGALNRRFVASRVFSNSRLKKRLNNLVHPKVEKKILQIAKILSLENILYTIVEAALIYEAGLEKQLDYVVVVDSPVKLRMERVRARDAVSQKEVTARMKAQWSVKKKRALADFIIQNDSTKQALRSKVLFLHKLFSSLSAEASSC